MPAPTLIKAKVKYAANNPKDFGNGPRINVVATPVNGGDEIKLWGDPDDALANLQKGQEIEILQEQRGDKTIHRLLQHAEDIVNQGPTTHQNGNGNQPTPEQLEAKFEGLLRLNAARYGKALKIAKHIVKNELGVELGSPLQEDQQHLLEPLKCIASSLFIESCRGMRG